MFHNNNVSQCYSQKHLGVILDLKLTFEEHLNNVLAKFNKTVDLLRKLRNILPSTTLIKLLLGHNWAIVMSCVIKSLMTHVKKEMKSFQYRACLALTKAIRGTSKEKIYQELGLESLRDRRWCRKFCLFNKILENENPKYLFSLIPTKRLLYSDRNIHNIPFVNTKNNFFKKSFFHQP